jgi:hypothetical protein
MAERRIVISAKEDDAKAYTTYDGIVGRSFRRGMRKAAKALTLGLISGGDPLESSLINLAQDATEELPTAIKRSRENKKK